MHRIDLSGTHYEMGLDMGRIIKDSGFVLHPQGQRVRRFAAKCRSAMELYAPDLLDELRGVSEGAAIPFEPLLVSMLTIPYMDVLRGCTVVAVSPERTDCGSAIAGRNYDFFNDVSEESATTYITHPRRGYASVGNSDIFVGREDGINEKGLFCAMAAFFYPGLKPGLTFWFIVRLILETCADVDEGVSLLREVPHASSYTYLLADSSGKAVVAEPTVEGLEFRYPQDGLLVMTNHAVCPRWAGREAFVPHDSRPRYDRIRNLLGGKAGVSREDVKSVLRDHTGLVCSHGAHFPKRKFGTLWSVVGCPGEGALEVVSGHPCRGEYCRIGI